MWFLELRANKIARFAEGRFTEFAVPTPSAGLTALAAAPDGSVGSPSSAPASSGGFGTDEIDEFRLPRAGSRPFGVAVDASEQCLVHRSQRMAGMMPASLRAKAP